jgi:hypothetical protein
MEDDSKIKTSSEYLDDLSSQEVEQTNYTEMIAQMNHTHVPGVDKGRDDDDGFSNHDVRGRFNVKDEFVKNFMYSQCDGHLAVHELAMRSNELRGNEAQIFRDIDEDTQKSKINDRWRNIREFAGHADGSVESAPTPKKAKKRLERIIKFDEDSVLDDEDASRSFERSTA